MEDFVTFELAKKLREKGFDEECYTFYEYDSKEFYREERIPCCNSRSDDCAAPTVSQVLKWLREEKGIFIGLEYINSKKYGCCIIEQETGGVIAKWNWSEFRYASKNSLVGNTYENTILAGIEYTFDNLM